MVEEELFELEMLIRGLSMVHQVTRYRPAPFARVPLGRPPDTSGYIFDKGLTAETRGVFRA